MLGGARQCAHGGLARSGKVMMCTLPVALGQCLHPLVGGCVGGASCRPVWGQGLGRVRNGDGAKDSCGSPLSPRESRHGVVGHTATCCPRRCAALHVPRVSCAARAGPGGGPRHPPSVGRGHTDTCVLCCATCHVRAVPRCAQALVADHVNHPRWGGHAQAIMHGGMWRQPRSGGHDDKAHPPIHPTKVPDGESHITPDLDLDPDLVRLGCDLISALTRRCPDGGEKHA